jgi:phosphoribosylformylglycinamidine synthase PurS subunit
VSGYVARVYVTLKPTVNDPQGLTISGALHSLGFPEVERVRAGKYLEITIPEVEESVARGRIEQMCKKLLANPIIEDFRFELGPAEST